VTPVEAALLGLVQGLTEFLPVSSSGHLVIAAELLGAADESILFEVVVHVATLVAVLLFYRARIWELITGVLSGDADAWRYGGKLVVATVPAGLVGVFGKDAVEQLFAAPQLVGFALIATGAILFTTRFTLPRAHRTEPTWTEALLIGCGQALALVPGISRSGTTVATALALGIAPLAAAEFSFLMSVPAIAGAAVLQLPEAGAASEQALVALAVGSVAALLSGLAALWLFVRLLRAGSFHGFAWYAWAVGAAFLALLATR
jgi:undecaprenyl-diphosphatase